MRLTYTLLVISLHKINMLGSFAAPLNTRQAFDRQSVNESFYSVVGRRPERIMTLSPAAVWTHSSNEEFIYKNITVTKTFFLMFLYIFVCVLVSCIF